LLFQSIAAVINVFFLLGLGALLTLRKWITKENVPLISNLVVKLAVPCTIFINMLSAITRDSLQTAGSIIIVPAITVLFMYMFGWILSKYIVRMQNNHQRTFAAMAGCPSAIFIGLPIILAVFGSAGMPAAMFFIVSQTTVFWSLGSAGIQVDAQGKSKLSLMATLKRIFGVNVLIIIVVFIMALLNVKTPDMLINIVKYIGALSTPLSLFFSGNALVEIYREFGAKGLKITRDILMVILVRFIVSPLVALALCALFGISGVPRAVLVLMSAMPVMTQNVIVTGLYGGDRDYVALSFFWTTLLSIVLIPLYLFFMV
jgi:predicted permease